MLDTLKSKDQQACADFITEGITKLSSLDMNRILQECAYDRQRAISERHIAVLADLMKRDRWQPKGQIDFALLNGRLILVNGYHRAYAQIQSGKTLSWSIAIHPCKAEADVDRLYAAFDTNLRARNGRDILKAAQFGASIDLPAEMAKSLYAAVPFIASKFLLKPKTRNFLVEKQIDRRLDVAMEYGKAAARYAACLGGMPGNRRKKMMGGAITAVAVITFRFQSETAWQFWNGVAQNDGLKRGDPRLALVMDFATRHVSGGGNNVTAYAPSIIAWNAFFNDRDLRIIKLLDSFSPVIDGTPFDGKGWK